MRAELAQQREMIDHLATVQSVSVTQAHSGPLPAPSTMTEYKAHPDFYQALLDRFRQETAMVKDEQVHRHGLDGFNARLTAWALALAYVFMFSCFAAAVIFVAIGLPTAGLIGALGAITALAANLVYVRNKPPQAQAPSEEAAKPLEERARAE